MKVRVREKEEEERPELSHFPLPAEPIKRSSLPSRLLQRWLQQELTSLTQEEEAGRVESSLNFSSSFGHHPAVDWQDKFQIAQSIKSRTRTRRARLRLASSLLLTTKEARAHSHQPSGALCFHFWPTESSQKEF